MHDSENILRLYIFSGTYFNNAGRIQLLLSNADIQLTFQYISLLSSYAGPMYRYLDHCTVLSL